MNTNANVSEIGKSSAKWKISVVMLLELQSVDLDGIRRTLQAQL